MTDDDALRLMAQRAAESDLTDRWKRAAITAEAEADAALAKLARIAALCDQAEANRWYYPDDNGLTPLATYKLRAVLDGIAS